MAMMNLHQFNDRFSQSRDSDDDEMTNIPYDNLIGGGCPNNVPSCSSSSPRRFVILSENQEYIRKFNMTAKNIEIRFNQLDLSADIISEINAGLNEMIEYLTRGINIVFR